MEEKIIEQESCAKPINKPVEWKYPETKKESPQDELITKKIASLEVIRHIDLTFRNYIISMVAILIICASMVWVRVAVSVVAFGWLLVFTYKDYKCKQMLQEKYDLVEKK